MNPKYAMTVACIGLLLCLMLQTTQVAWSNNESPQGEIADDKTMDADTMRSDAVESLREAIPSSPTAATVDSISLIERAAATRRLDAATLVVKSLVYHAHTSSGNETISREPIPAIDFLKRYYDSDVLPLIFEEGIATDKAWMRERCALAVQKIATEEELEEMRSVFSLNSTINPKAKEFDSLLLTKDLKVRLFDSAEEQAEKVDEAVRKLKQRAQ